MEAGKGAMDHPEAVVEVEAGEVLWDVEPEAVSAEDASVAWPVRPESHCKQYSMNWQENKQQK